jgi:hypothetical protein
MPERIAAGERAPGSAGCRFRVLDFGHYGLFRLSTRPADVAVTTDNKKLKFIQAGTSSLTEVTLEMSGISGRFSAPAK